MFFSLFVNYMLFKIIFLIPLLEPFLDIGSTASL